MGRSAPSLDTDCLPSLREAATRRLALRREALRRYPADMNRRRLFLLVALLGLAAAPSAEAAKKWRTKEACTLIENASNDGDSFHIRVNKRRYIFRLLWVDTPETDLRYPERVAEQAAYFGITSEQAIKVGKDAVRFSANFLKEPFTVYTQFDDAMGASAKDRDYAIIKAGDTYLMEALVANGLARIHGIQEMHDDGPSVSTMRMRLKGIENDAKKNRRGAWGLAAGGGSRFDAVDPSAPIAGGEVRIARTTAVYDAAQPTRLLGMLSPGKTITALRTESAGMIRVRIALPDGRTVEGLCRRTDLGL